MDPLLLKSIPKRSHFVDGMGFVGVLDHFLKASVYKESLDISFWKAAKDEA